MVDALDTAMERPMALERLQEIAAAEWSWELVVALQDAIAGAPHWRHSAQELLRRIARGELPAPLNEMGAR